MKKIFQTHRKLYAEEIFEGLLKGDVEEISVPGTSAKFYISGIPLFIYLKHSLILIPTFHLLMLHPTIIQSVEITEDINGKIIESVIFPNSVAIGSIFSITQKNRYFGVGKIIKINKKHQLEVICSMQDPISQFIIEKYPLLQSESDFPVQAEIAPISSSCSSIDSEIQIKSPDEILYKIAISVLKHQVKKANLPLEPSAFLNMILKSRGKNYIAIKETSYKKISNFLEFLNKKELVVFKKHPSFKREMITEVNYDMLRIPKSESSSSENEAETIEEYMNPVAKSIELLFSLPIEMCEIMHHLNLLYDYQTLYKKKEITEILAQYIRVFTDSDRSKKCVVDPVLSRAFSLPEGLIDKSCLFAMLNSMITKKFLIMNQDQKERFKVKNEITFIEIRQMSAKVNKFAGLKPFVSITGFGFYQVNVEDLCDKLKKIGKSVYFSNEFEVKLQGKNSGNLVRIFTDTYKIPMEFIMIVK